MKIGITGAAGGIGRRLTDRLGDDHELVLFDSVTPEEATVFDHLNLPSRRRLEPLSPKWPYHVVDITRVETLSGLFQGLDVVIHLAGIPTGDWEDAQLIFAVNVNGTFNVFQAAHEQGVGRVVAASSIMAFGSLGFRVSGLPALRTHLPLQEDDPRVPEDPYGLSKGIGEDIGRTFERAFGMEVVNLRLGGVMMPWIYEDLVENGLEPTTSWSDWLPSWVHVDDVLHGIALAATVPHVTGAPITLVANDSTRPEPTMELIHRFAPQLLQHLREPLPGRASLISNLRARTLLGFAPVHTLDAAVKEPVGAGSTSTG